MRISCEVVFSRYKANPRQVPDTTKPRKAFVILQRLRQTPPQYQITVAVAGDKTGNKFELNKPPIILDKFIRQGKLTITFQTTPAVMVCINKACPEGLGQLVDSIRKILKGENVDIEKVKVKSSDFTPTNIIITNQNEYRNKMKLCSQFLKTLKVEAIDLRMPDKKWIECRNITQLTISGNPIGTRNTNLDVFCQLKQLQTLEIRNCSLGDVPIKSLCDMFKGLPKTLTSLDVSENVLTVFPPLFHLVQLRSLNLAFNNIKYLPSRIGVLQNLINIDLSQNAMNTMPLIFSRIPSIQRVGIHANDELVRLQEEVGPLILRKLTKKLDRCQYTHEGGVDTLMTIAANALHRYTGLTKSCRKYLPLCLRFEMDDMMYEKPGVSPLEMCTTCLRLRHIRVVKPQLIQSRQIANTVDVIDRFVVFDNLLCIDCYRRLPTITVGHIPVEDNYFEFSA